MGQSNLFDHGRHTHDPQVAYVATSATSRAAAESVRPVAASLTARILSVLAEAGQEGLSDEEMQNISGMPGSSQRPRRIDAVQRGLVADSGRTRTTRSGRQAVVWCLTHPRGYEAARRESEGA